MFHFPFKNRFSVAFSPPTTVLPWLSALIAWYIIVPYEYDNTVIKYVAKAHLYFLPKLLVSSHAVHILDTYILFQSFKIYETYYHVNHIHIIHCRHLYMNEILFSFHCYLDQLNLENIQHQHLTLIISYFNPNFDFVFIYQLFCWVFLHSIYLTLYIYFMHYHEKNHF